MRKVRTVACELVLSAICVACSGGGGAGSGSAGTGAGSAGTGAGGAGTGAGGAGTGASGFDNPDPITAGTPGGQAGMGLPPGTCADGLVVTTRVAPRVVLVLDGSCSMSTDYPANGTASATQCTDNTRGRWAALRRSLIDPEQGVVSKLQGVVEFGVAVYGSEPTCPLPSEAVRPALNNLPAIQARMPAVQPGIYTPTGPALDWVYDNLIEATGPDDRAAAQVVILATDGEPNSCARGGQVTTNYQPSIDAVRKGTMKGATTYVISLADATGPFHDHLQELANLGNPGAGGRATVYEPASPAQLAATLQSLVGGAVGCEIELNGAVDPAEACTGTVKLDGAALGCNDPNGWTLADASHIKLQGQACQTLMNKPTATVQAQFSCSAFRPD